MCDGSLVLLIPVTARSGEMGSSIYWPHAWPCCSAPTMRRKASGTLLAACSTASGLHLVRSLVYMS